MCSKSLVKAKLFSWKEYLDHLKAEQNYDSLTILKMALEIYTGECKGYAKVPDEKDARERALQGFMKDLIKENVQNAIFKYKANNTSINRD